MPKGHKRKKNPGVGVDFKRVKHKVGKRLPRAANATDTSFKAGAISLPGQSVGADRGGAPVTGRNLSLPELCAQAGHYSERVRRDALAGMAELLAAHPGALRAAPAAALDAAAPRLADAAPAVRAAAADLLARGLLPALGRDGAGAFFPLLAAHVARALTALDAGARADAVAALGALAEARPDLAAAPRHAAPALRHFCGLLARGGARGRSVAAGSLAALAGYVAGLERVLRAMAMAVGPRPKEGEEEEEGDADADGAGEGPDGADASADGAAGQPLFWRRCEWPPLPQGGGAGAGAGADAGGGDDEAALLGVSCQLVGLLVECLSECGVRPSPGGGATVGDAAAAGEAPEGAACAASVLRCCELLVRRWGVDALLRSSDAPPRPGGRSGGGTAAAGGLEKLVVARVGALFPVREAAGSAAAARGVGPALAALNTAAAELLGCFLPRAAAPGAGPTSQPAPGNRRAAGGGWEARLLLWFEGVLEADAAVPPPGEGGGEPAAGGGGAPGAAARGGARDAPKLALPPGVYASALAGAARAAPLCAPPERRRLLAATAALWRRAPRAALPLRRRVLRAWGRLLRGSAAAALRGGAPLVDADAAAGWVREAPRFLWEASGSGSAEAAAAAEAALRLLLDAARLSPRGGAGPLAAALAVVAPQMAPLLVVPAPPGGGGAPPRPGPLAALPPRLQALAADVMFHLGRGSTDGGLPEPVLKSVAVAALAPGMYPAATALRLVDVAALAAARGAAAGGTVGAPFGGLLLTLVGGVSASGAERGGGGGGGGAPPGAEAEAEAWRRHEAVCEAACAAAAAVDGAAAAAGVRAPGLRRALWPPLLALCARGAGPRPLRGALALALACERDAAAADAGAALPAVVLDFVQACAAGAAGGLPDGPAAAALGCRAVARCALLEPTLAEAARRAGGADQPPAATEACLLVLAAAAESPALQPALLRAGAGAAAALGTCRERVAAAAAAGECATLQALAARAQTLLAAALGRQV